jgi:hypothetical protein
VSLHLFCFCRFQANASLDDDLGIFSIDLPPRVKMDFLLTPYACRRPGILVLINDADWELEGQDAYELQAGDEIVFVSTLHGG